MPVQEAEAEAEEFVEAEDEDEEEVEEEEEEEVEYVDDADVDLDEVRPLVLLSVCSICISHHAKDQRVHELLMPMHKIVPAAWHGRPLGCRT